MKKLIMLVLAMFIFAGVSFAKDDEEKIDLAKVPEIVKKAVYKIFPSIELVEAEVEKKKSGVIYELEGKVDGKLYEFKIKADGTLLKMELEEDDDDDDDDDDEDDDDDDD